MSEEEILLRRLRAKRTIKTVDTLAESNKLQKSPRVT